MTAVTDTIWTLAELDEKAFERRTTILESWAEQGDWDAKQVLAHVDAVIDKVGSFDPELVAPCSYTFAHTRHWCGNVACRDS